MSAPVRRHYRDPEQRFLARIEPLVWSDCIVWMGHINANSGHGRMRIDGEMRMAHQYAWTRVHGAIPEGKVVDHICHVPSCVNVEHLRLVTPQQNQWNRKGSNTGRTLPRGVYRHGRGYRAVVVRNRVKHRFGTFPTIEQADIAAQNGRAALFGIYAGGN